MMGHAHATTGAAAWVAITTVGAEPLGLAPLGVEQILAGALVTAGAALLPDADHHSGTIAHSLPPLSNIVTSAVGTIAGGHRHATHSLLGILVTFTLAWTLAPLRIDTPWRPDFQLGAWLLVLLPVAFAARALRLTTGWLSSWTVAVVAATAAVWFAPTQLWWLPLAVGTGCAVHVAGDALTTQGVPLLWPLLPRPAVETPLWRTNGYLALPLLGTAGSIREWLLVIAVNAYLIWAVIEHIL